MKDTDGIRNGIRVPVFFDPADWRKIEGKAKAEGVTRSQFLIDCVIHVQGCPKIANRKPEAKE